MRLATVTLRSPAQDVTIAPAIYGQFFEHVEDCIYPGVMDEQGVRGDVVAAARELRVPAVRWPGGCFADVYHWADGVGALEQRPVRRNWHWDELEPNRFGTHEFLDWCERVGAAPYINVNLGTGSLVEALRWLDYCNGTRPTSDVRSRRINGRDEPWDVRYWGIGNETWGHWEAGHSDAATYARTLANWADFFKRYDRDLTLVGVGSDAGSDPSWDTTVLDAAGQHIDLLSLHIYGASIEGREREDREAVVCSAAFVEKRLGDMGALVRSHNETHGRSIGIAVDEWNIRHYRLSPAGERHELHRASPRNGTDALFAAGVFHALIRNADLVRMANYVFLVNGNAVLDARNGTATRTPLADVFQIYRSMLSGHLLEVEVGGPAMPTPRMWSGGPDGVVDPDELPTSLPVIDAVASASDDGQVTLALLNRSADVVTVDVQSSLSSDVTWSQQYLMAVDTSDESLQVSTTGAVGASVDVPGYSVVVLATYAVAALRKSNSVGPLP